VENILKKILIQSYPILLDTIPNELSKIGSLALFNPTITEIDNNLLLVARESSHPIKLEKNYTKVLKTNLHDKNHIYIVANNGFIHVGMLNDQILIDQYKTEYHGLHDIRLFKIKNQIWGLGGMLLSTSPKSMMKQVLFQLAGDKVAHPHILNSPFGVYVEKNWMPVVKQEKLFFIYSLDPFILLEFEDKKINVQRQMGKEQNLRLFGNTPFIKYQNVFLGLAHHPRVFIDKYFYLHCFVVLNENLEFIEETEPFFIMRRGVEFACGLLLQGENLHITFGVADRAACMATIKIHELKKLVHSIN